MALNAARSCRGAGLSSCTSSVASLWRAGAGLNRAAPQLAGLHRVTAQALGGRLAAAGLHTSIPRDAKAAVSIVDATLEEEDEQEDAGSAQYADRLAALADDASDTAAEATSLDTADYSDDEESEPLSFASLYESDGSDADSAEVDPSLLLANCGLSDITVRALESKGILSMFPIQKMVFSPAMDGADLIARAKTGSGKTLAFALPVVEKILGARGKARAERGRLPQCIVLTPTRELAKQVEREFTSVAPSLMVGCYYGGAAIGPQLRQIRDGVDIVVGTPGRIIDLIEQRALKLGEVKFVILDEADTMLSVGFEEDVETILKGVPTERQTMLFSATVPHWVKKLVQTYLKDPVTVDLIGKGASGKLNESITPLAVQVSETTRRSVLVDLLTVYGEGGKAIVFTQTKRDCDEVAGAVGQHLACEPLHGDMAQKERERVMAAFRVGRTTILVATDVAARGLDIPAVDLVVHYELPRDAESFLHRSGRTGRANRKGTTIAMFTQRETGLLKRIIKETETAGVKLISPPGPQAIMEAAAKQVMYRLDGVDEDVKAFFTPAARLILEQRDPVSALEAALSALSGIKSLPKQRSLLTLDEAYTTMQLMSAPGRITKPGNVSAIVARLLGDLKSRDVGRIRMIVDEAGAQEGAAFDVPHEMVKDLMAEVAELEKRGVKLTVPSSLPAEESLYDDFGRRGRSRGEDRYERRGGGGGGGRDGGRGGGGRRGGSRFGDFGGGSRSVRDRDSSYGGGGGRGGRDRESSGGFRGGGGRDSFGSGRRDSYGGGGGGGGGRYERSSSRGGGGGGDRYGSSRDSYGGSKASRGWDFNADSGSGSGSAKKSFDRDAW